MTKRQHVINLLNTGGITNAKVADIVGCTRQYVSKIAKLNKQEKAPKVVGVFSDMHIPADHPGFLPFVIDTCKKYGVTDYICLGDIVDNHRASFHKSEPDSDSIQTEHEKTKERLQAWAKAFPKLTITFGNHDLLPIRKLKEIGLTANHLKSMNQFYDLPDTWEWIDSVEIDGVIYEHGMAAGGAAGARNLALAYGNSVVVGHSHSFGNVAYIQRPSSQIFGMNVGCGIEDDHLAFRYGKNFKFKSTLGMGIIFNSEEAIYIPMPRKYKDMK